MKPNEDQIWDLDYDASVAMRYHAHRRAFLDATARLVPVVSLVLGSSAFAVAVAGMPNGAALVKWLTLALVLFSAINLAFGVAERARLHDSLFRRWAEIREKLAALDPNDSAALQAIQVARAKIDGETPLQLYALTVMCQNEENEVRRANEHYNVPPLQRFLAQFFTVPFFTFPLVKP